MANTVIVVDMQRGFMSPEGTLYCGDAARAIIAPIRKLVEEAEKRGDQIIFTQDTHTPDDKEFQMFPPHCVRGTPDWEIIPELADLAARHEIVEKNRYSAFFRTDLEERLAKFKPDKIIVVGDCTDICVMHTVADARNRDYPVEVPMACVASFDPEAHKNALRHMEKILGAKIVEGSG